MLNKLLFYFIPGFVCLFVSSVQAQKLSDDAIRQAIQEFKEDPRGPYAIIKWFCDDGTIIGAKEECPEPGGNQHAQPKWQVTKLGLTNHIFLGQILTGTYDYKFWDASNNHSRMKQYSLEKYLGAIDNGWIMRKAQFYRGAFQIEDEREWGQEFLTYIMGKEEALENNYYLIRQAVKDLPHETENTTAQRIRAYSKFIADEFPEFENIRVKIHSRPDATDMEAVSNFGDQYFEQFDSTLQQKFVDLTDDLEKFYQPADLEALKEKFRLINHRYPIRAALDNYVEQMANETHPPTRIMATAELLMQIREDITTIEWLKARLGLLDISMTLEALLFKELPDWKPETATDLGEKICYTGMAATATGFLELWEWEKMVTSLAQSPKDDSPIEDLQKYLSNARRIVEWGTNMPHAVYQDVVELFEGFEPLVRGFYDDRIRSSVLLNLGQTVGRFGDLVAKEANFSNQLLNLPNAGNARGLNPGLAMGELVVVDGNPESVEVSNHKIYVFDRPPADLKPVAGILTVTEGNMVSHVQLLARNLAIPNAVISGENLEDLKKYHGQTVFYAVSNKGTILMKPAVEMNAVETELFAKKERNTDKITVPVEKIDLSQQHVLSMANLNSTASGVICVPSLHGKHLPQLS